jgi:hypothetical protein
MSTAADSARTAAPRAPRVRLILVVLPLVLLGGTCALALRVPTKLVVAGTIGARLDRVLELCGEPVRRWTAESFECLRSWPCSGQSAGGDVLFYGWLGMGWYFFFDASGSLVRTEFSGS